MTISVTGMTISVTGMTLFGHRNENLLVTGMKNYKQTLIAIRYVCKTDK